MDALAHARQTRRVQAYRFTSTPIATSLVDVPTGSIAAHTIAHTNKVMISDAAAVVITESSFNCTKMAERQSADSLLAIQRRELRLRTTPGNGRRAEPYADRGR